jgi:hypothetical protein
MYLQFDTEIEVCDVYLFFSLLKCMSINRSCIVICFVKLSINPICTKIGKYRLTLYCYLYFSFLKRIVVVFFKILNIGNVNHF